MTVHDILSSELAVAVVELDALVQLHVPGPAVLSQLPAVGQPGLILAVWRDFDKPLERRVMLDHVVRTAIDPRADVVPKLLDQPQDQAVHLGRPRRWLGLRTGEQ